MHEQIPVEPVSIVTEKSFADFIQYMLRRIRQTSESFFFGILRAAIIQFMTLQMNNIRHSGTKLTTLSIPCGDDTSERVLEGRWRSRLKEYRY